MNFPLYKSVVGGLLNVENALMYKGFVGDLDDAVGNSIHRYTDSSINAPSLYGVLVQFASYANSPDSARSDWRFQMAFSTIGIKIYYRHKINTDGNWSSWVEII